MCFLKSPPHETDELLPEIMSSGNLEVTPLETAEKTLQKIKRQLEWLEAAQWWLGELHRDLQATIEHVRRLENDNA